MDVNSIESGAMVDIGLVRGVITILTFAVFIGITWWAYHGENRKRFEEDALLPFADGEDPSRIERGEEAEQ